jgi:hypothetical protein
MINPKELRVGSWIFNAGDEQKPYLVEAIDHDKDGYQGYFITYRGGSFRSSLSGDYVEPIPLTTKILELVGFEKINHRFEGIIYKKEWLRITESGVTEWRGGYIKNKPLYVHQLQNLYQALTGEDLYVNLTKEDLI